jgi:hypothetical protein
VSKPQTKINYKVVALYAVLAAVIAIAAIYFLWTPMRNAVNGAVAYVQGGLANLNLPSVNISQLITDNLGAIVGTGIGLVGAVATYAKYKSQVSLNDQLVAANTDLKSNVNGLTSTVVSQADTLKMYEQDTTPAQLQESINSLKTEYNSYVGTAEGKIEFLEKKNRELQDALEARPVVEVPTYK